MIHSGLCVHLLMKEVVCDLLILTANQSGGPDRSAAEETRYSAGGPDSRVTGAGAAEP